MAHRAYLALPTDLVSRHGHHPDLHAGFFAVADILYADRYAYVPEPHGLQLIMRN